MRRFADELEAAPGGVDLVLDEVAARLGLGQPVRPLSPLLRAVRRCVQFGFARYDDSALAVRLRMPMVGRRHLLRLPHALQEEHRHLAVAAHDADQNALLRRRARLVALDFAELGLDEADVERQLLRRGVHPAQAFDAAHWACSGQEADVDRTYTGG
jgi:hypothetical protein